MLHRGVESAVAAERHLQVPTLHMDLISHLNRGHKLRLPGGALHLRPTRCSDGSTRAATLTICRRSVKASTPPPLAGSGAAAYWVVCQIWVVET